VQEAAALLDVEPAVITRALELDAGRLFAGSYFAPEGAGWQIPETCVSALLSGRPRQAMLSVQTVAAVLDCSYHHAFRKMKSLGLLVELRELGLHRVAEADLWRICRPTG
jgi:hypothetical protein